MSRATRAGISYTVRETHEGNSGIVRKGSYEPLSIERILEFPKDSMPEGLRGPWLVVRRHQVVRVTKDPYLDYPLLRASMWGTDLEPEFEALPLSQVDGHFAKCIISWERQTVAVIILLSREHGIH